MLCPTCKTVDLIMTERVGVEIDYCPQCRGVWLDRGELDKIIERSGPPQASPQDVPPPYSSQHGGRYRDDDDHEHGEHGERGGYYGRKKSFWRELFD